MALSDSQFHRKTDSVSGKSAAVSLILSTRQKMLNKVKKNMHEKPWEYRPNVTESFRGQTPRDATDQSISMSMHIRPKLKAVKIKRN